MCNWQHTTLLMCMKHVIMSEKHNDTIASGVFSLLSDEILRLKVDCSLVHCVWKTK